MRQFVEKCLATVSRRLSARELLKDPFLQIDDCESDLRSIECRRDFDDNDPISRQPFLDYHHSNNGSFNNGYSNGVDLEAHNGWDYQLVESEPSGIELFEYHDEEHSPNVDISIKGKKREDDGIFLRLRIADKEGNECSMFVSLRLYLLFVWKSNLDYICEFLQAAFETFIFLSTLRLIQH